MNRKLQRILSMILVLSLMLGFIPGEAAAYFVPGENTASPDYTGEITILNEDGSADTLDYDESWEDAYPYGAFVFGNYEATIHESAEDGVTEVTIPVYRLGGTTGRATAYIHYQPVISQDGDDSMTYAYAASGRDDVVIQVEDPQPVARYQPVGMDRIYAGCELTDALGIEDGNEAGYQVVSLAEDVQADTYVWQMAIVQPTEDEESYTILQSWTELAGSTGAELQVDYDMWYSESLYYDFRCIYTVDGKTYCSSTALGIPFSEDGEELEEMPDDIELNAEPSYTVLNFENEYDDCVFELTFAENEWVKDIIVTVIDDDIPELPEMGLFTLVDSYGGEVFDAANTLTLLISDNDPFEPSQLGFTANVVEADQDSGSVTVTVERTGGLTYPVSVEYRTVSGTAVAGKQFSNTSGTLLFAGDVSSIDIHIPLVAEAERTEPLEFSLELTELKGGGENYSCTLENDRVTVSLTSSGRAVGLESGLNLASVLATASGEDVSAAGTVTEALLPESTTVTGEQDTTTAPEIVGEYVEGSGNSRTYNYQSGIELRRGASYSGYWTDYEIVVSSTTPREYSRNMNYYSSFSTPTFESSSAGDDYKNTFNKSEKMIQIAHNNTTTDTSLTIEDAGLLFQHASWKFYWEAAGRTETSLYVKPYCCVTTSSGQGAAKVIGEWSSNFSVNSDSSINAWEDSKTFYYDLGVADGDLVTSMRLELAKTSGSLSNNDKKEGTNSSSIVYLSSFYLQRRVFSNTSTIGLTVHTANDSDLGLAAAIAKLDASTGVYDSMRPQVSLVEGQSGVDTSGNLYVGSKLKISLTNTVSYFAAQGTDLAHSIYLTDESGNIVPATVEKSGDDYIMTLLWDNMKAGDLSKNYTINVVMERRQTVTLDISPSLGSNATQDAILAMWKTVAKATETNGVETSHVGDFATYGYSKTNAVSLGDASKVTSHFQYSDTNNYAGFTQYGQEASMKVNSSYGNTTFTNLQWINFNQDPEDIILFNGRSYAGNETIYLSMADLATSELTFYYYNKNTLSMPSTMVTTISETALYYDGNGNGQIDGYYNAETGYFVLDEDSGDQNLGFVSGEFNETAFQPVVTIGTDGKEIVHQYFLKVYYTMNPRSYQAPAGINSDVTTTVLPVLMSTITDSEAFSALTVQQRSYRYLQAGYTLTSDSATDYTDSSQGHPMYGAKATARTYVDIPLGGDTSPVSYTLETTVDGIQTKVYTWEPDYYGNLLVAYDDPEPINHDKNITGQTIPIAGEEPTWKKEGKTRVMTLTEGGKEKLNNYLGSMVGDTTFGLAVDAHLVPTRPLESLSYIDPESITRGNVKAVPSGEYLANTQGSGDTETMNGGSGGNSAMAEFEVDLGVNLPSTDFELGDYATIIMDGNSVGFSVGLPIASMEEKPDEVNLGEEFKNANEGLDTMKQFASSVLKKQGTQKLKDLILDDESYNDAKGGTNRSHGFEFSMSVAFTILFEYNPIDNNFYFKQAALAAAVGFEFTVQYRFSFFPPLYIYLKTGLEVEIGTGFSVARTAKEGGKIATSDWLSGVDGITSKGLGVTLAKGESACFVVDINKVRGFHLYMDGSVYMEVLKADQVNAFKSDPFSYKGKYVASGRLSSDGEEAVEVFLEDGNYRAYVVLTALETTSVYSAVEVTGAQSLVYWEGLKFAPSGFIEVGAGIGVELLKFELYLRASMEMEFTFGGYSEDAESYRGAQLNSFDFSASLGFNITLLFFNYSMDFIGYYLHIEDTGAGRKVESKWGAFSSALGGDTRSAGGSGGGLVSVSAPTDTSDTQRVVGDSSNARAYNPTDDKAPFQLSGYGTSGDGFKLMDGLSTGNSYQVFRVGKDNYILYTQSRSGAVNALDTPQLVLSKVVLTGNDNDARLQNPVGEGTCLVVDKDDTGDLDYAYSVNGDTLTVIWTSYDEASGTEFDATDAVAASRRTVVKTASIDLSGTDDFSEPEVITEGIGDFRYLPQQEGGVSIYAVGTGDDNQSANLRAYLMAVYGMTDEEATSGNTTDYTHATAVYRWNYQSDLNAMYGSSNKLVAYNGSNAVECLLGTGEAVENLETITIDGTVYAAYSTVQYAYFAQDGKTAAVVDQNCDLASIKRLYLRSFDGDQWGVAKLIQTVIDFDRCDNNDTFGMSDGVYSGGSLASAQLDPYFSNLKFLNAKLADSASAETVFLYEMGGNTYVIDQEGITNAVAGGSFTITPIFTTSDGSSEGTDAVIASDNEGNLAVVYTAPMNATGSNALYVAWWDTNLGQWGTGNVLAMNHLQVYEDAAKYSLSAAELELAYLGQSTGNTAYDDYIDSLDSDAKAKAEGDMEQLTFSNLQITMYRSGEGESSSEQLLVMTQGSLQKLTYDTVTYTQTTKPEDENTTSYEVAPYGDPDMGFYAISFGAGQQGVGQASLSLTDYDFTAGSQLSGTLSFVNTGTTAIRASRSEPATVTLTATGEGYSQTIAQWSITESVPSGGKVELNFLMNTGLTADLPTGTKFSASISEDEAYISGSGGTAFRASTGTLLTVEAKPELQFEGFSLDLTGISGDNAIFEVDMWVSDRGNEAAENVFVQFSYESSKTNGSDESETYYLPLSLTGSNLEVDEETAVTRSVTANDLSNGIVYVGDISKGYQRRIHGTLSVPVSAFRQDDISGLHLKAEIFSDADTTSIADNLYSSSHSGEYSASNNVWVEECAHETFFNAPKRISMALGSTLRLPITYASTSSTGAEINVKEISDGTADWTAKLGLLYYDSASKTIVAAPSNGTVEKTGIIQVEDLATNSIYSITYEITAQGNGINIYKDDESFTFYNANGDKTNVTLQTEDWRFNENVTSWDGGDGGKTEPETPMNSDTVYANNPGASLTFQTTADTMTLWFDGEVTVSSDLSTFASVTAESEKLRKTTGKYPLVIDFDNDAGVVHTVTIKAVTVGTVLDRYTATYVEYPIQVDENAPQIYWSRSFPDTASIENGGSVTLTGYVVDDGQLKEVTGLPEGTTITETSGSFWSFSLTITENDLITIKAADNSGKTTTYPLRVDWFNNPVSAGTVATAPDFPAGSKVEVQDEKGNAITGALNTNEYPYVFCNYQPKEGETIAVLRRDGVTAITPESDGRWKITENGVYLVRVTAADGSWAQAVLIINCIDDGTFTLSVSDNDAQKILTVTVGESTAYTLTALTVNDYSILNSRTFEYTLGGEYTVIATNSNGRTLSTTVTASVPVALDSDAVTVTACTDYDVKDGTVTVELSGIHGGSYDSRVSESENNSYQAIYNATLLAVDSEDAEPGETALTDASWQSASEGKFVFANLSYGWYRVAIRDSHGNTCIGKAIYIDGGLALSVTDDAAQCTLTVSTNSHEALTALTVNGYSILGTDGRFPYTLGGNYTVSAENSAGRTASTTVTVRVPLTLDPDAVTTGNCSATRRADGTIQIRLDGIHGGNYNSAISQPEQNSYRATYTAALIPIGGEDEEPDSEALASASWISANSSEFLFSDLSYGWYQLRIKDSYGTTFCETVFVGVEPTIVGGGYSATVVKPTHGTITVTPSTAQKGDLVNLTVSPDRGYTLKELTVTDRNGNQIELNQIQSGRYTFLMPDSNVTIRATFTRKLAFQDVSERDYYYDAVQWAVENNITTGTSDTTFGPETECTRAQAVTFLWRAAGSPTPENEVMPFTDVAADSYYYNAVLWAVENNISTGISDTTFGPDEACTRAQIVTFLWRSQGTPDASAASPFADVASDAYHAAAVLWAVENGITTGTSSTTFSPDAICTRAQIVTFLYRSMGPTRQ